MEAADEVTGGQSSTDDDKPGEGLTCTAEGGPASSYKLKDDSSFSFFLPFPRTFPFLQVRHQCGPPLKCH